MAFPGVPGVGTTPGQGVTTPLPSPISVDAVVLDATAYVLEYDFGG